MKKTLNKKEKKGVFYVIRNGSYVIRNSMLYVCRSKLPFYLFIYFRKIKCHLVFYCLLILTACKLQKSRKLTSAYFNVTGNVLFVNIICFDVLVLFVFGLLLFLFLCFFLYLFLCLLTNMKYTCLWLI